MRAQPGPRLTLGGSGGRAPGTGLPWIVHDGSVLMPFRGWARSLKRGAAARRGRPRPIARGDCARQPLLTLDREDVASGSSVLLGRYPRNEPATSEAVEVLQSADGCLV